MSFSSSSGSVLYGEHSSIGRNDDLAISSASRMARIVSGSMTKCIWRSKKTATRGEGPADVLQRLEIPQEPLLLVRGDGDRGIAGLDVVGQRGGEGRHGHSGKLPVGVERGFGLSGGAADRGTARAP